MKQRHPELVRSVPLLDYEIERGGDGRTVVAYAATFGDPYEVIDFDGHYDEQINRAAFDRFLTGGFGRVKVVYNHGRTPSFSTRPIATPVDVRPDARGLVTRSRYAPTDVGEQALIEWREGLITGQSFRGPVNRSSPRRQGPNGRPVIERLDLGLIEYGPCPFPINVGADLVAIRSAQLGDRLGPQREPQP
jgi:phage head maturation protease